MLHHPHQRAAWAAIVALSGVSISENALAQEQRTVPQEVTKFVQAVDSWVSADSVATRKTAQASVAATVKSLGALEQGWEMALPALTARLRDENLADGHKTLVVFATTMLADTKPGIDRVEGSPELSDALMKCFRDGDPLLRRNAAIGVVSIGGVSALRLGEDLQQSFKHVVRQLSQTPPEEQMMAKTEEGERPVLNPQFQELSQYAMALTKLARHDGGDAMSEVTEALQNEDLAPRVRLALVSLIGRMEPVQVGEGIGTLGNLGKVLANKGLEEQVRGEVRGTYLEMVDRLVALTEKEGFEVDEAKRIIKALTSLRSDVKRDRDLVDKLNDLQNAARRVR